MSKDKAVYVLFEKTSGVMALARQPGNWTDKLNPGFGMRVSPKRKAVWFMRYYDAEHKERTKTLGLVDSVGDGLVGLSYEAALEKSRQVKHELTKTPQERELERSLEQYETLEKVFEKFLSHRRKKGGLELLETTKEDYRKTYRQYMQPVKDWKLADTKAFQWKEFLLSVQKVSPAKAVACKNIISGIYNHLMANDVVEANPIAKVTQLRLINKPAARETRISTLDIAEYFNAIDSRLNRQDSKDALMLLRTV